MAATTYQRKEVELLLSRFSIQFDDRMPRQQTNAVYTKILTPFWPDPVFAV